MWCAECNTHCNTHCNTVTVYVQCWKSFWKIPVLKDFWRELLPGRLCGSIGPVELMDALAAVTWDLLSTRVVEMFHLVSTGWFDIQMQGMVLTSGWGSGSPWSKNKILASMDQKRLKVSKFNLKILRFRSKQNSHLDEKLQRKMAMWWTWSLNVHFEKCTGLLQRLCISSLNRIQFDLNLWWKWKIVLERQLKSPNLQPQQNVDGRRLECNFQFVKAMEVF